MKVSLSWQRDERPEREVLKLRVNNRRRTPQRYSLIPARSAAKVYTLAVLDLLVGFCHWPRHDPHLDIIAMALSPYSDALGRVRPVYFIARILPSGLLFPVRWLRIDIIPLVLGPAKPAAGF